MREKEFKGKRCHDGKWVYGNLIKNRDRTYYVIPPDLIEQDGHHLRFDTDEAWWVIPETVCEYTGMNDRFEAKVFEGDIIKLRYQQGHEYVVFWNEKMLAWCAKLLPWCAEKKETNILLSELQQYKTTLELLNNKHDSQTFGVHNG